MVIACVDACADESLNELLPVINHIFLHQQPRFGADRHYAPDPDGGELGSARLGHLEAAVNGEEDRVDVCSDREGYAVNATLIRPC